MISYKEHIKSSNTYRERSGVSGRASGRAKRKKKFYGAHEAWKVQATNIEQSIADQVPFSLTQEDETILHLKDLRDENRITGEKVRLVPPQQHETRRTMMSVIHKLKLWSRH